MVRLGAAKSKFVLVLTRCVCFSMVRRSMGAEQCSVDHAGVLGLAVQLLACEGYSMCQIHGSFYGCKLTPDPQTDYAYVRSWSTIAGAMKPAAWMVASLLPSIPLKCTSITSGKRTGLFTRA